MKLTAILQVLLNKLINRPATNIGYNTMITNDVMPYFNNNYMPKMMLLIICVFMMHPCFAAPTDDLEECEIRRGDISCVKDAVARGADVNAYGSESGNTALMRAAVFNASQIAKFLLENNAQKDLLSENETTPKWTALEIAARQGNFDVVKEIIKAGGDPSGNSSHNTTPLRAAINGEHYDIVRWLIEQGANPAVENSNGADALDSLLSQPGENLRRNEDLLLLFFDKGLFPHSNKIKWSDSEQGSYLCHAINEELLMLAVKLVQKGLFIDDLCISITPSNNERFENSPLYLAISRSEDVKLEQQWSYLKKPEQYTKLSLLLIKHGANVNASSLYNKGGLLSSTEDTLLMPLDESLRIKNRAITQALLSKGAKIGDGSTIEAVRKVATIEKWTDVINVPPSQLSATSSDNEVNSSIKMQSPAGSTEVVASDQASFELAKAIVAKYDISEFLNRVANVNYVVDRSVAGVGDKKLGGMSPLGIALIIGRSDVVSLLLAKGADPKTEQTCIIGEVKSEPSYGITADTVIPWFPSEVQFGNRVIKCSSILVAVKNRLNSIVGELLAHGVDVNSDYLSFGSILNYSLFDSNTELTQLLLKHGANVSTKAFFGKDNLKSITSFQLAITFGKDAKSDEIAIELLNKGSDFGSHLDGRPALHYAIDKDNQRMLLTLLGKNADPDSEDLNGRSPLVYAAERSRKAMIANLRQAGATEPRSYDKAREEAQRWNFKEAEYWLAIGKTLHFNEKVNDEISQIILDEKHKQAVQLAAKANFDEARGYCFMIQNKDDQNGCLSDVEMAKGNLSEARGYCFMIQNKDGQNGCLSGIEDNLSEARGYCFMIQNKDGQNGCLSGIETAKGNLNEARGYCFMIQDKDGQNGCLSGIEIAKSNFNEARGYCFMIQDKDGQNGCLSGIEITKVIMSKEAQYD